MAKITAIKQQLKNSERASIFLDGRFSFSLTVDQLLAEKLRPGLDITDERLRTLQKLSAYGKVRQRTIEWLWRRPHSERELRGYLRRKELDDDQRQLLIADMQQRSYQSDQHFAQWLIELRQRQSKSLRQIKAELASKGIAQSVYAEFLELNSDAERQRLRQLASKKFKQTRYQQPQSLMRYLAAQGYSFDDIKSVLAELTGKSAGDD